MNLQQYLEGRAVAELRMGNGAMLGKRCLLPNLLAGLCSVSLSGCWALPGFCDRGNETDVTGVSSQKLIVAAVYDDNVVLTDSGDVWHLGETDGEDCPVPLVEPGDKLEAGPFDDQMLNLAGVFLAELRLEDTDCRTLGVWLGRVERVTAAKVRAGSQFERTIPPAEFSDGSATWLIDPEQEDWLLGDEVLIAKGGSAGEWYIHRTGRAYLFGMGR